MKKRRQHYVWKKYLDPWVENGKVWCCRKGQTPFHSNPINVLVERDFYKVTTLTKNDLLFIKKIAIDPIKNPILKDLNQGWIDIFERIFRTEALIRGIDEISPEAISELDKLMHNLDEDYHCSLENIGDRYIKALVSGDSSFYDDDDAAADFSYFMASQYFRTKKIKDGVLSNFEDVKIDGLDFERVWPILRHIFSTSVGFSIYANRSKYKLVKLINESEVDYITGDQPIVNTYSLDCKNNEMVQEVEFYYPVSPRMAVIVSKESKYANSDVSKVGLIGVSYFNDMVAQLAHEQIIGRTESCLDSKKVRFK